MSTTRTEINERLAVGWNASQEFFVSLDYNHIMIGKDKAHRLARALSERLDIAVLPINDGTDDGFSVAQRLAQEIRTVEKARADAVAEVAELSRQKIELRRSLETATDDKMRYAKEINRLNAEIRMRYAKEINRLNAEIRLFEQTIERQESELRTRRVVEVAPTVNDDDQW